MVKARVPTGRPFSEDALCNKRSLHDQHMKHRLPGSICTFTMFSNVLLLQRTNKSCALAPGYTANIHWTTNMRPSSRFSPLHFLTTHVFFQHIEIIVCVFNIFRRWRQRPRQERPPPRRRQRQGRRRGGHTEHTFVAAHGPMTLRTLSFRFK